MSEIARTYRVVPDPEHAGSRMILCLLCETVSTHPADVAELYCPQCQHHHEDPVSNQEGRMRHDMSYVAMARSAYHAYTRNVVGRNFAGLPLPQWEDLPTHRQIAWECAVRQIEVCLLTPEEADAAESRWTGWTPPEADV